MNLFSMKRTPENPENVFPEIIFCKTNGALKLAFFSYILVNLSLEQSKVTILALIG